MRRIGSGAYVDDTGTLHLDVPELLTENGYADTPAARELVTRVAVEIFGGFFPGAPVTVVDAPFPEGLKT